MGVRKALGGNYQMKITLKGIRPPIWRRVQVPGTIRLARFHAVIQTVFGWTDSHLHQFLINGESYGRPEDFDEDVVDEAKLTLAQVVGGCKRFTSSDSDCRKSLTVFKAPPRQGRRATFVTPDGCAIGRQWL